MHDQFSNHLLIAMPHLNDGNFSESVTYLCEHTEHGALGLVINRPTNLTVSEMLDHVGLEPCNPQLEHMPVFWGGPVQPERGFVLHKADSRWESTLIVGEDLAVTTSKDVLDAIAEDEGPEQYLITLGYAGWEPGQLEEEILGNTWLNVPATNSIIFQVPVENRWHEAAHELGIDLHQLSHVAGHA